MRKSRREPARRPWSLRVPGVLAAVLSLLPADSRAHDFAFTDVRLELRADRTWVADVGCDVDALALGVSSSADSAVLAAEIEALSPAARDELVARLAALLKRRIRVRFDGTPAPFECTCRERGHPPSPGQPRSALGLVARLSGRVPEGAREVTFFASRAFPQVRLVGHPTGRLPRVRWSS